MRALYRLRCQWAKCVGGRPGGPRPVLRSIGNAAPRDITAPPLRDPGRPWPAPGPGGLRLLARTAGRPRCAPVPTSGRAGETQSAWRSQHAASRATGARCGDPLQHASPPRAARFRPATTPAPIAAPPSRTTGAARCTGAVGNGCAGNHGRETGKPGRLAVPHLARHAGRPCAGNSRGATACPGRNAGRWAVGTRARPAPWHDGAAQAS